MDAKKTKPRDLKEAGTVEQLGFELSIMQNLLLRKNIEGWFVKAIRLYIISPVMQNVKKNPHLIPEEILPKLRHLHEQLERSIQRIEHQLQKERAG